jgi:hypothetical protein
MCCPCTISPVVVDLKSWRIFVGLDDEAGDRLVAGESYLGNESVDCCDTGILQGLSTEIFTSKASSELPRSSNIRHLWWSLLEKQPEERRHLEFGCLLDSVSATLLFSKTVGSEKSSSCAEANVNRLS